MSAIALALLVSGTPSSALAELSPWYTDAAESTDGRYLFVSLSNRPLDEELKDEGLTGEVRDQIEFFRGHYPVSGMYRNDETNSPLWEFDRPWPGEPIIAPDGAHVIFEGSRASNEPEPQVVEFTHRGETMRSYRERDMISARWLKHLLNGGRPPTHTSTTFDPAAMTYTIATSQGEEYVFNVKNGGIVAVHSPFPAYYAIFGVALVALIVGLRYWLRRRRRSNLSDAIK